MFQANPDAGIHLTLSGAVVALIADKLWDRFRKNGNGNGNEKVLQDIRDGIRELLVIVKTKNNL